MDIATTGRRVIAALALLTMAQAGIAAFNTRLIGPEWAWDQAGIGSDASLYAIRFASDGTLRVRADCNSGSARYLVEGERLWFSHIAITKKGCGDDSKDREFLRSLAEVVAYRFDDGRLVLTLASGARMQLRENV